MKLTELEKNISILEDIHEIQNMHREFVLWLNNRQYEEWLNRKASQEIIEYFSDRVTAEIDTEGVVKGKIGVIQLFGELIKKGEIPGARYIVSQPVITVDGDTAKGSWVSFRFKGNVTTPPASIKIESWEQGKHECEYIKDAGKWKFLHMKWLMPWPK
jgi:hypothetical protein